MLSFKDFLIEYFLIEGVIEDLTKLHPTKDVPGYADALKTAGYSPNRHLLNHIIKQHGQDMNGTPVSASHPDLIKTLQTVKTKANLHGIKDPTAMPLQDLHDKVKEHFNIKATRKDRAEDGLEPIHNQNSIQGYHVKTKESSIYNYGPAGKKCKTKWCVSADAEPNMETGNVGNLFGMHYGPMYTIHHQGKTFAYHPEKQVVTSELNDGDINLKKHLLKFPEHREAIEKAYNHWKTTPEGKVYNNEELSTDEINHLVKHSDTITPISIRNLLKHKVSSNDISDMLKKTKYRLSKIAILKHPKVNSSHLTQGLNDSDYEVRLAALNHKKINETHLTQALNDPNVNIRMRALDHKNINETHLTQALNDNNIHVRRKAIEHVKINNDHINIAMNDDDAKVKDIARKKHEDSSIDVISRDLDDSSPYVRANALKRPNVTTAHIDKALKNNDPFVRSLAVQHPLADESHITQAVKDDDENVAYAGLSNPKANADHITELLKNKNSSVKIAALMHKKANANHITQALNDPDQKVRLFALSHKKANESHFRQALNDDNETIRRIAERNLK